MTALVCSHCQVGLTKDNQHCDYHACTGCQPCQDRREAERAGRPPLHT